MQYVSFLLALIFYNASLQINIVPQSYWSIFSFNLADENSTKSAKTRLETLITLLVELITRSKVRLLPHAEKMDGNDVRITGAVARQTAQTGFSGSLGGSIEITACYLGKVYAC